MKTSELTGAALDWAVAKCEGMADDMLNDFDEYGWSYSDFRRYSTNWAQGGSIIERECIGLRGPSIKGDLWAAFIDLSGTSQGPQHRHTGPTPLIAAMRCYVASKFGNTVEIPDELL